MSPGAFCRLLHCNVYTAHGVNMLEQHFYPLHQMSNLMPSYGVVTASFSSLAEAASGQGEASPSGNVQASALQKKSRSARLLLYCSTKMIPIIIGGVGVGLIALRAINVLREKSMTRKAENLLCEVSPPSPSDGKESPGCGPTYRNIAAKDGFPSLDGVTTLYELFRRSASQFPNNPCLGTRKHTVSFCRDVLFTYCVASLRERKGV